jgi:ZIP family zinc transporter
MLELIAAASATALATGLGAIPVWMLGERAERLRPALTGLAAGVMAVAAVAGLLLPASREGSGLEVAAGAAVGVAFLIAARAWIDRAEGRHAVLQAPDAKTAALVFLVLLVHSLPEGFAIGTAYASETAGLGFFVVAAIAIQNVPEGTSVAIPLAASGASSVRQFWAAVLTSAPQPVGAVIAFLLVEQVSGLLPLSFAFAAGAMLALVVLELGPGRRPSGRTAWAAGALSGGAMMIAMSWALGV